jgi:hypothetical protein
MIEIDPACSKATPPINEMSRLALRFAQIPAVIGCARIKTKVDDNATPNCIADDAA